MAARKFTSLSPRRRAPTSQPEASSAEGLKRVSSRMVDQSGDIVVGHSELTGPKKDRRTAS